MDNHRSSFQRFSSAVVFVFALTILLASCKQADTTVDPGSNTSGTPINTSIPKSQGSVVDPVDNPSSAAKVELGRHLFYDQALSVDGSTSCSSCHAITSGLADARGLATSMGFERQMGIRNAPALANVAFNTSFTWDGKFASLEAHAQGPIFNSIEMGNNFSIDGRDSSGNQDTVGSGYNSQPGPNDTLALFKRLNIRPPDLQSNTYPNLFMAAWGTSQITMDHIAKAIAAFERTFISTQSVFDQYNNGNGSVLKNNPQAVHGLQLFTDVNGANCISCHSGYNFTDQQFHDNGIGINANKMNQQGPDKGRSMVSKDPADDFKFKTPSLRNVFLTGPYMHDGRFTTLEDVLANYNKGGLRTTPNQDAKIKPLYLNDHDVSDIIEFLKTLTDNNFANKDNPKYTNPWSK
jgi:cytochrome c peroxidase